MLEYLTEDLKTEVFVVFLVNVTIAFPKNTWLEAVMMLTNLNLDLELAVLSEIESFLGK